MTFNTRQYELNQASPEFAQDYIRKRESRILKLNFSYRFGKFDASLFKKEKERLRKRYADGRSHAEFLKNILKKVNANHRPVSSVTALCRPCFLATTHHIS